MAAGHAALERHRQRRPHALPSLSCLARWLNLAFDFKKLALGLDSKNRLPEKISYDYEFTDLKRAYGHHDDDLSSAAYVVPGETVAVTAPDVRSFQPSDSMSSAAASSAASAVSVPVVEALAAPRCDAWSRWARRCHGQKKGGAL